MTLDSFWPAEGLGIRNKFMFRYLIPALLAASTDWLQGPYLYSIYQSYGYTAESISRLFLCGFLSSMLCGTWLVGACSRYGPKLLCMCYCILCGLSCVLLHFPAISALLFGRVLGGMATSVLFSAFDSWMIREHQLCGLGKSILKDTFERHAMLNSLVAIIAGLLSSRLVTINRIVFGSFAVGGLLAPVELAFVLCVLCYTVIAITWRGGAGTHEVKSRKSKIVEAKQIFNSLPLVLLTGITSLYEAAMYIFVFMWTPILAGIQLDLGVVFAGFMMAAMVGSRCISMVSNPLLTCVAVSTVTHGIVAAFPNNNTLTLCAFIGFEFCVGMYFPAIGILKAELSLSNNRSIVYTLMRVPLNLLVLTLLATGVDAKAYFQITSALLLLATALCLIFRQISIVHSKVK